MSKTGLFIKDTGSGQNFTVSTCYLTTEALLSLSILVIFVTGFMIVYENVLMCLHSSVCNQTGTFPEDVGQFDWFYWVICYKSVAHNVRLLQQSSQDFFLPSSKCPLNSLLENVQKHYQRWQYSREMTKYVKTTWN